MTWLLAAHAAVGFCLLAGGRWLRRAGFLVGAVPMVAALGYVVATAGTVGADGVVSERASWVAGLDLSVGLRLDGFAQLMVVVVSGIGVAVMAYATRYFADTAQAGRVAGLLVLFSGSMLGVVLADSLVLLYVCWELTSITSWLLIGSDHTKAEARAGALHALLVTGAGGLAMLAGFVVLAQEAGTWSLSELLADPPGGRAVGVGLALVLVGVVTKSAQFPTHAWLPGAMVAPTPVSAYLHSATMVKAGIYVAARFAPAFALVGVWQPAVVGIGLLTMVVGGLRALRQHDLKLLLAMGTISQLGFLLALLGAGVEEATVAGCVLLVAHALFKSALFLVVGIIDHQAGTRDRRRLPGFGPGWGAVKVVAAVSAASMAGLPPLVGFVAKEGAYEALWHEGPWGVVATLTIVAGSVLTFAYSARFVATALAGPRAGEEPVPAPRVSFVAPAVLLAGLTVAAGPAVAVLAEPLIDGAVAALVPGAEHVHLALWHGVGTALALSVVTVALGAVVVAGRASVERLQDRWSPADDGDDVFAAVLRGLNVVAGRVAAVAQSGSLPVYLAVVLLTAVALPGGALAVSGTVPDWPRFAETPLQVVLAALVVGMAVAAAAAKRRFVAVVFLGAVGYGMGLVFVVQGAPDLALTQFAVETLSIVVFMLVLRHLPDRFERGAPAIGTRARLAVATTVAAGVFVLTLTAAGSRTGVGVSQEVVERALPDGGGSNVVNVVLVDIRGLDTLGEISVLVLAAVGVVSLARAGRPPHPAGRHRTGPEPADGGPAEPAGGAGGDAVPGMAGRRGQERPGEPGKPGPAGPPGRPVAPTKEDGS